MPHNRVITSEQVYKTMLQVDRSFFVKNSPYEDRPQSIGFSATISAPHMHAYAMEALKAHLKPGARVLDVGSGSGYLTVCFALMVRFDNLINSLKIIFLYKLVYIVLSYLNLYDKFIKRIL
ncbi:unnamed protein product [Protopolystoma xenopodis]|uniref:protein-L-isoaspartate(D-aspartate) O-methyltransferase n=1 Tax=Protopolystoma xenopodis TaxID=117903 RepID=A0A3S4ZVJ5_9PLAT|nr:unnamed protein product [Protopolystoma xenopodis]